MKDLWAKMKFWLLELWIWLKDQFGFIIQAIKDLFIWFCSLFKRPERILIIESPVPSPIPSPPASPVYVRPPTPEPPRPPTPEPEPETRIELKLVKGVWTRLAVRIMQENKLKDQYGKNYLDHVPPTWEKIVQMTLLKREAEAKAAEPPVQEEVKVPEPEPIVQLAPPPPKEEEKQEELKKK